MIPSDQVIGAVKGRASKSVSVQRDMMVYRFTSRILQRGRISGLDPLQLQFHALNLNTARFVPVVILSITPNGHFLCFLLPPLPCVFHDLVCAVEQPACRSTTRCAFRVLNVSFDRTLLAEIVLAPGHDGFCVRFTTDEAGKRDIFVLI